MTKPSQSVTCICGSPCVAANFYSYVGCTNPRCKWFDNEVIRMMEEARKMLEAIL